MAKIIDLSGKLTSERPVLKLAEGVEYTIDNRKNTVLQLNQVLERQDLDDVARIDEVLKLVLGEVAVEEMNASDLAFADYRTVFFAVIAGATGDDFDSIEARFQASR